MADRMDIDALRALVAIDRHGGVTRAADHLALSQSAVSHKIRRLELSLDSTLLARRAGGPLFTEAGEQLLDYARRMTDLHDEALASLGKKSLSGRIRLGMTEDTTISEIARIMGRFTRLNPEAKVRIRVAQSLTLQDWLQRGEIDLAIMQVFAHQIQPGDIRLFEDRLHWIKSYDLQIEMQRPIPFLSFDPACFYNQWAMTQAVTDGLRLETVLECPSAAGVLSAARSGLGVALLNGMHVPADVERLGAPFPNPPEISYVARAQPRRRNPVVRDLAQVIARDAERAGDALKGAVGRA